MLASVTGAAGVSGVSGVSGMSGMSGMSGALVSGIEHQFETSPRRIANDSL